MQGVPFDVMVLMHHVGVSVHGPLATFIPQQLTSTQLVTTGPDPRLSTFEVHAYGGLDVGSCSFFLFFGSNVFLHDLALFRLRFQGSPWRLEELPIGLSTVSFLHAHIVLGRQVGSTEQESLSKKIGAEGTRASGPSWVAVKELKLSCHNGYI